MFSKAATWSQDLFRAAAAELKQANRLASPAMKTGFLAAGVAAPILLSNKDQNPGEKALVTTPVLAAAFATAPAMKMAFQRSSKTAKVLFTNYGDFERILKNNDIYALENVLSQIPREHRAAFAPLRSAVEIGFYSSKKKTAVEKAADLKDKTGKAVTKIRQHMDRVFSKFSPEDERWKSVAAAVKEAVVDTEPMDQELLSKLRKPALPEGSEARTFVEEMLSRYLPEGGEADSRFALSLRSRIQRTKGGHVAYERPLDLPKIAEWDVTGGVGNVSDILRQSEDTTRVGDLLETHWDAFKTMGYKNVELYHDQESLRAIGLKLVSGQKGLKDFHVGIEDVATGKVFTGADFTTPGVFRNILRMTPDGRPEYYRPSEFALSFLSQKGVTPEKLQQDVNKNQVWQRGFQQNSSDGRSVRRGERQAKAVSKSSVPSDLPVHYDGIRPKDFTYDQTLEMLHARTEAGEKAWSSTGPFSKNVMWRPTGHELTPRVDKATTMGLTQMKAWDVLDWNAPDSERVQELKALAAQGDTVAARELEKMSSSAEDVLPKILTAFQANEIASGTERNIFNLRFGSQHVAGLEYHGLAAQIAHRGGLPMTERAWREAHRNAHVDQSLNEFAEQKIRRVMSGEAFEGNNRAWYDNIRSRMAEVRNNAIRHGSNVQTTEEQLFAGLIEGAASKRGMIREWSQLGTAGGEGHYGILADRVNIPIVRHHTIEAKELRKGLKDLFVYDENGKLKENWQSLKVKRGRKIGLANDVKAEEIQLNHNGYLVGAKMRGSGDAATYDISFIELSNISDEGFKTAMGNTKMTAVRLNSENAIPLLEDFNRNVGNDETAFLDGIHAIARSDSSGIQKFGLDLPDMINLSDTLMKVSAPGQTNEIKAAREELQNFLVNEAGVEKTIGSTYVVNQKTLMEKAIAKFGEGRALSEKDKFDVLAKYENHLKDRLFGTKSNIDYDEMARMAKEASESLVKDYGLMGQLETHLVNQGLANSIIRQQSPALIAYLERKNAYQSRAGGRGRFIDFLSENFLSLNAAAMEGPYEKAQRSVSPTEDYLRLLKGGGMHYHLRDIEGRLKPRRSGDPGQFAKVLDWMGGRSGKPPEGSKIVSIGGDAAVVEKKIEGTILDWKRADLKDNFFYKLSTPVKLKYGEDEFTREFIAHPGYAGFSGAPNMADGLTGYSTEVGKAFENLVKADAQYALTKTGQEHISKAVLDYEAALKLFVSGKRKQFRPAMIDPLAMGGRLQYMPSGGDIFNNFVSVKDWEKMTSRLPKDLKTRARESGYFMASTGRHPESFTGYVRVRPHELLPEGTIGLGDEWRIPQRADFDTDYGELFSVSSDEAWREAEREISDPLSRQSLTTRAQVGARYHEVNATVTQDLVDANAKSVRNRALKNFSNADDQFLALEKRLAGQFIGHYSHATTIAQLASESIPGRNVTKEFLEEYIGNEFATMGVWNFRQATIALQKHEGDVIRNPQSFVQDFHKAFAMRNEEGGQKVLELLQQAAVWNKDEQNTYWTKWHEQEFPQIASQLSPEVRSGQQKINLLEHMLKHDSKTQERVRRLVSESDESVHNAMKLLTTKGEFFTGNLYNMLEAKKLATPRMTPHLAGSGFAAEKSAGMLKTIAETIKKFAGEGKAAARPGKNIALAGVLGAAAAGAFLVGGPGTMEAARTTRPQGRPEEQLGVTDQVPGSPEEGSMSGNPQRNVNYRQGPNRSVVAPMRRGTNVDVTMDSPDESALSGLRRRLQGIGTGDAFVTNNHIGGWRDGSTRLATRERLRGDLDRY